MASACGIPRHHQELCFRFTVWAIRQQPGISLPAITDTVHETVFRHQSIVQRKHCGIGKSGKSVGNGPVAAWTACRPGATVNVEYTPARVGTRRDDPFTAGVLGVAD